MAASKNGKLKSNQIRVAEGTEVERVIDLKVPRGKKYREQHLRLLETFGDLQDVALKFNNGSNDLPLKEMIDAVSNIFGLEEFEDTMIPFVLSLESDEDIEWADKLLPLEKFMAYMEAASFIVAGGQEPQVQAAIKK